MPVKPFRAGNDVAQKTQRWNQDQIDRVERAKEEQRRREQEADQNRNSNSRSANPRG
jgi:hypothetical protein